MAIQSNRNVVLNFLFSKVQKMSGIKDLNDITEKLIDELKNKNFDISWTKNEFLKDNFKQKYDKNVMPLWDFTPDSKHYLFICTYIDLFKLISTESLSVSEKCQEYIEKLCKTNLKSLQKQNKPIEESKKFKMSDKNMNLSSSSNSAGSKLGKNEVFAKDVKQIAESEYHPFIDYLTHNGKGWV